MKQVLQHHQISTCCLTIMVIILLWGAVHGVITNGFDNSYITSKHLRLNIGLPQNHGIRLKHVDEFYVDGWWLVKNYIMSRCSSTWEKPSFSYLNFSIGKELYDKLDILHFLLIRVFIMAMFSRIMKDKVSQIVHFGKFVGP